MNVALISSHCGLWKLTELPGLGSLSFSGLQFDTEISLLWCLELSRIDMHLTVLPCRCSCRPWPGGAPHGVAASVRRLSVEDAAVETQLRSLELKLAPQHPLVPETPGRPPEPRPRETSRSRGVRRCI